MKEGSRTKKDVQFVVTGFGPFQNVEENPTTILSDRLMEHLKQVEQECAAEGVKLSEITRTMVIETSAEGAREALDALRKELEGDSLASEGESEDTTTTTYVLLHLGVNYKGEKFQLEKLAYNDASFRIPDERGYKPQSKLILDNTDLGSALETRFDLETIKELLGLDDDFVVVSDDPGRFVCNYTYCYSLAKFDDEKRFRSLFLHVPPFRVVDLDKQLEFVTSLMQTLYKAL